MNRLVFCFLAPLVLSACASTGFTTTSSGPRKPEEVVVVEVAPGEVRAAQLRKQEKEIEDLRDALDANRSRAEAAARRSDAASQRAQSEIDAMQSGLAEMKLRADAAVTQSRQAFDLAREFLTAIVDVRKEQTATVERNIGKFDRMDGRLDQTEGRILEVRKLSQTELATAQSRSSTTEQTLKNTDLQLLALREQMVQANRNYDESRKRSQAELGVVRTRSSEMEQKLKTADQKLKSADQKQRRMEQSLKEAQQKLLDLNAQLQQSNRNSERARKLSQTQLVATIARSAEMEQQLKGTDRQLAEMSEQLLTVNRDIVDARAAIDSGPMLDMLRRLESTQRETSGLRGLIEEMQQEQQTARKRLQDYYLDLDARIQDLQVRERAGREAAEAQRRDAENAAMRLLEGGDIPVTEYLDAEDIDSAEIRGAVDAEPSASVRDRPNQIEAMPLPRDTSPNSSIDAGFSEPEAEVPSSPGESASRDDTVLE
jgi:hypothetical protein